MADDIIPILSVDGGGIRGSRHSLLAIVALDQHQVKVSFRDHSI
jgi:hypothetical protein